MDEKIKIEDGHIVFIRLNNYEINLTKCRNYEEILGWVFHLSQKNWVNCETIQKFIQIACDFNSIKVPSVK